MIISNEDALHKVETIISRMDGMLRSPGYGDYYDNRDWTEEFDLMAKMLTRWTRWLSHSAKTDWRIHTQELKLQYGLTEAPKRQPKVVDTSGDTFNGIKFTL